jgi:predicted aspartyl protease
MISRRTLLASLAALPFAGHAPLAAQAPRRVGGARIVVIEGRVWMQVKFGDRGPYAFVIDTGAWTNLIRIDLARELRLRQLRSVIGQGLGGTQEFPVYEGEDVKLGNISIGDADFAAYDGRELNLHPEAMGALSASVLSTADSDLDFEQFEWRIYPDGRGERPGYELLSSEIGRSATRVGASPIHVDVEIDGRRYRLHVDTGAPRGILLYGAATRRSGLWNDSTPYSPSRHFGIGGAGAQARLVRVGEVGIGSIRFARPLVSLSEPEGRQDSDGLLGLGLLEMLNLSTDVRAGRLWAKRNARAFRAERYGISGLWVEERGGGLVIDAVGTGSPAAEAGLRAGDRITGVTLAELVRSLGGRPGNAVEISYQRGGEGRTARIVLRAYL